MAGRQDAGARFGAPIPTPTLRSFPVFSFHRSLSFSTNILCADLGSRQQNRAAPPQRGLMCSCWFSLHVAPMLPSSCSHALPCSCPFLPACCCASLLASCTHVSFLLLGCQGLFDCCAFPPRASPVSLSFSLSLCTHLAHTLPVVLFCLHPAHIFPCSC